METKRDEDIETLLEDEWLIVRNSGEIPEIAYNSSVYFLERAKDGPQIQLSAEQKRYLQEAAVKRCEEIILRDMYHENVGTSMYRGIERSIYNYGRFLKFCSRQKLDPQELRLKTAALFTVFLEREYQNVSTSSGDCTINCSFARLKEFAALLGVDFSHRYGLLKAHCPTS